MSTSFIIRCATVGVLTIGIATSSTSAPPASKAGSIADADITQAIERVLPRSRVINFETIDVHTERGIVTITGQTDSVLAKELITNVALQTYGVRGVVNRLEVKGEFRGDAQIEHDVKAALKNDPATEAYEITVKVNDGVITLTGMVQSRAEQRLAGYLARGVCGVTAIQNQLTVRVPATRPDAEIAAAVRGLLRWDYRIDDVRISVRVQGGTVYLIGVVGSAVEKQRAVANAWIAGVANVKADALKIDESWDRGNLRRSPDDMMKSDLEIRRAVIDALIFDPRVSSTKITVSVSKGVVTLSGSVENFMAKRAAADDASNTVGVRHVENNLQVRLEKLRPDGEIQHDARVAIRADPVLNRCQVRVDANNGFVALHGTVGSPRKRERMVEAVARVEGVVGVRNYLQTDIPEIEQDPEIAARDNRILENIEDQLWWSPHVQANEVVVRVRDGVATLTGLVESWSESLAASESAYQGGARRVVNLLRVRRGPVDLPP